MQKTMKSLVQLAAVVLALSTVGACADVLTLRVAWQTVATSNNLQAGAVVLTPHSPTIKLGTNQTAKVLHFYCIETNLTYYNGFQWTSSPTRSLTDSVKLQVDFGDLAVSYYQTTLNGKTSFSSYQPGAGLPALVGPATLELLPGDVPWAVGGGAAIGTAGMAICTIDVSGTAEVLPGDAVVQLPQSNSVEVKLETSVNTEEAWQPATLGRYDVTDQKRFFRLKIDKVE
jgi:hypothetical protein